MRHVGGKWFTFIISPHWGSTRWFMKWSDIFFIHFFTHIFIGYPISICTLYYHIYIVTHGTCFIKDMYACWRSSCWFYDCKTTTEPLSHCYPSATVCDYFMFSCELGYKKYLNAYSKYWEQIKKKPLWKAWMFLACIVQILSNSEVFWRCPLYIHVAYKNKYFASSPSFASCHCSQLTFLSPFSSFFVIIPPTHLSPEVSILWQVVHSPGLNGRVVPDSVVLLASHLFSSQAL